MQKRGQVTLFVVIGVLIIIIVFILVFLMKVQVENRDLDENLDISQTKLEADGIVRVCLRDVSEYAVWIAAEYGGYALHLNADKVCVGGPEIKPYIYDDRIEREPEDDYVYFGTDGKDGRAAISLYNIEDDSKNCLEGFIKQKMISCINGFAPLWSKGWLQLPVSVDDGLNRVDVGVTSGDEVVVDVNVPRRFVRDESNFVIGSYSYIIDFDFPLMFDQIKYAVRNCDHNKFNDIKTYIRDLDEIRDNGYAVYSFDRYEGSGTVDGRLAHQYIIKKGDKRFKFGISC